MTGRIPFSAGRKGVVPPGTRLNNMFEIERLLSAGGMGEVYKGHNILTEDAVAIKIVLPEFAQDDLVIDLFRKEARILNHLYHEAIVRYYVFSIDAEMGRPFLAMEYVDGPSLSERVKEAPLPTPAVLILLKRLAGGLQKAHEAGVIHRDIAPDNIILPDGSVERAKIIDFGIARSAVGGGTLLGGKFAGKYNFVSPEQLGLFGAEVTDTSDIYSLGLVVAACVRGHPLDMGGTQFEVVEKRRTVPDLSGIDQPLRQLIEAMLQPDPLDRPQAMAEITKWLVDAETALEPHTTVVVTKHPTSPPLDGAPRVTVLPVKPSSEVEDGPLPSHQTADDGPAPAPQVREKTKRGLPMTMTVAAMTAVILAGVGGWYLIHRPDIELQGIDAGPEQAAAVDAMLHYIGQYAGGDCFFALPAHVNPSKAEIIGFGDRIEPFKAFRDAFRQKFGFEPQLELRLVSNAQCVVVKGLSELTTAGSQRPVLQLDRDRLRSGDVLSGVVSGLGNRHAEVLLVDNSGLIYNLRDLIEATSDGLAFKGTFEMPGSDVEPQPQLLIAIASAVPLQSLSWGDGNVPANQLVADLLREVGQRRTEVIATAGYIKIGH